MRFVSLALAAALALASSGCAYIEKETGLTPAQQAQVAVAVPCIISAGAAVANGIIVDGDLGQSAAGTSVKVATASADACKSLGGVVAAAQAVVTK